MNIIHYFLGLPPLHSGGLMIYARDLAMEQKKLGHNVMMLIPGRYSLFSKVSKIIFYKSLDNLNIFQIINPPVVSFKGVTNKTFYKDVLNNQYEQFLKKYKIEVLHLHSFIGLPLSLLKIASQLNIKIVFTTHDYYSFCPKIYLFNEKNEICSNFKNGFACVSCNISISKLQLILKRNIELLNIKSLFIFVNFLFFIVKLLIKLKKNSKSFLKKSNKYSSNYTNVIKAKIFTDFRNYYVSFYNYIDIIIFNSNNTKNVYSKYLNIHNINYKVMHVTHSKIKDFRNVIRYTFPSNNTINFIYIGYLNKMKGFHDLINVFETLKISYTNWILTIYGNDSNINKKLYDENYYRFKGTFTHQDLLEIFSNANIMVIPSKCQETFGFIGLEAISFAIPLIVSENVGFKDLINENETGIIYKESNDNYYLKNSIELLLTNPQLLHNFHQNLKKYPFHLDMISHCYDVVSVYSEILTDNNNLYKN